MLSDWLVIVMRPSDNKGLTPRLQLTAGLGKPLILQVRVSVVLFCMLIALPTATDKGAGLSHVISSKDLSITGLEGSTRKFKFSY